MRQEKAKDKRKMRAHTKRTARRPGAKAEAARRPGTNPQNAGAPAGSPAHSRRAAAQSRHKSSRRRAGRKQSRPRLRYSPDPRRGRPNSGIKFPAHTAPAEKLTGQQDGRESRAKRLQQRQAAQKRPARHMARHTGRRKNPSEQAKLAFALLPARRGLVKRGRQKFASLFLAGTAFLLRVSDFTARCARFAGTQRCTKGGAAPFIPRKLFEKSLSKNFHEGPGAPRP